jgi:phosphoesterase RecJ-like protein
MVVLDKNTLYITLTQAELDEFKRCKGDTEGIIDYGLSIKYHYLLLFYRKIKDGIIKISFVLKVI